MQRPSSRPSKISAPVSAALVVDRNQPSAVQLSGFRYQPGTDPVELSVRDRIQYISPEELETEIPLFDVNAKVVNATSGKEESRLVIARNDGMAFGLLKPKALKKGAKDLTYEFVSHDVTVLRLWAGYINYVTTRLIMQQIAFGAIAH